MVPSETVVERVGEMYNPKRIAAILAQFNEAEGTMGTETLLGELNDESLEPGLYLEIYECGFAARVVRLAMGEHVIGRSPDCTIILQNRCASRMHCMLTVHADGRVVLRDLQSTNHVLVNGVQMEPEGICEVQEGAGIILASHNCSMVLRKV